MSLPTRHSDETLVVDSSDCSKGPGVVPESTHICLWSSRSGPRMSSLFVHLDHGNPLPCMSLGQAGCPPLGDVVKTEGAAGAWLPEDRLRLRAKPTATAWKKLHPAGWTCMEARDLLMAPAQQLFLEQPNQYHCVPWPGPPAQKWHPASH